MVGDNPRCQTTQINSIRENYKNLEEKVNSGNTVVFLWKKKIDIKNANYKNIKQDMEDIFHKSKLFIEEKK